MTPDPAVVVVGDLATDIVAHLAEPLAFGSDAAAVVRATGGGSGANVAAWLAVAGISVTFAGRVGTDASAAARVRELQELGVAVHAAVDHATPTGTVIVLVTPDGERTMLPDRGANANLRPDDLDDRLFTADRHLHLSGYTLFAPSCRAAALHALHRAREAGMTISVDPASAAPLHRLGAATFLEWTAGVGLCLPNRAEAAALTGIDDPERAAVRLATHFPQVVVTLGAEGAMWTDGQEVLHTSAPAVDARDTTGAGDAFTAGFLAATLAGDGSQTALRHASELAGRAVCVLGGRPSLPRL